MTYASHGREHHMVKECESTMTVTGVVNPDSTFLLVRLVV